jgi:hypothetical protein
MATFSIDVAVNSKSVNQLEEELQSLESQFKTLKIGDPGFNELGNRIKGVRSQLKDVELQFEGLDKEQRATALVDTFNGLTGAVGAVSSAFIAFGAESKAIEDAEKKLLGVIGVVNGLRDVSNSFVAANKLLGSSFKAAFTTATGAINVTRVALAGLGIGAIIFAVTELADAFDIFGTKAAEANDKTIQGLERQLELAQQATNFYNNEAKIAEARAKAEGKSIEEVAAIRQKALTRQRDQAIADTRAINAAQDEALKRVAKGSEAETKLLEDFDKKRKDAISRRNTAETALELDRISTAEALENDAEGKREKRSAKRIANAEAEAQRLKDIEAKRVQTLDQTISAELSAEEAARQKRLALAQTDDERVQIEYENKLAALKEAQIQEQIAAASNAEALALIDKKYADLQIVATAELDKAELELQAKRVEEQKKLDDEAVKNAEDAGEKIKQVEDAKRAAQKATLDATSQILGTAAGLAKEGSDAAKAFGLAQIGVDTAIALTNAQASAFSPASPDNAVTGGAAGIAKYLTYAAIILSNVAKAKAILKNPEAPSGGAPNGGLGAGGGANAVPSIPATQGTFTPLLPQGTTTPTGQGSQGRTPVFKTYVLAGDVTDAQEAEAQINQKRKF